MLSAKKYFEIIIFVLKTHNENGDFTMKMNIDRNNYESYFLDYLEGNLDEKFVDDFIEFLQQNPDLKQELSIFSSVSVEPEKVEFSKKQKLYKVKYDNESYFDKTAVESIEGDISEEEKASFTKYLLSHPEKNREFEIFRKTKLIPDESVKYSQKAKLYHRSVGRTALLWSVRIAPANLTDFG